MCLRAGVMNIDVLEYSLVFVDLSVDTRYNWFYDGLLSEWANGCHSRHK